MGVQTDVTPRRITQWNIENGSRWVDEARESPLDEECTSSALGSAFQENAAQLYRYIFSKVGNAPLAEDLTSQVFLKAMRWLQQDRSPASVRGWLYATARTTIVDYWREQARLETIPLDDLEIALFQGPDPEEEARRTRERAARVLCKLPEREREVLTLRYLRGYSAAEIGRVLGLPAGSVRMAQLRALRHAAALWGDEGMPNDRKGVGLDGR